jgi:DNA-binding MarR family transcriptional regulator
MENLSYQNGLLFTQTHSVVRDCIYDVLSKHDLTPSHWSILIITDAAAEGIRLSHVAQQMNVKAPLVTVLVDSLIRKELIRRLPHHSDGRAKLLVLTPQGSKVVNKLGQEIEDEIKKLTNGISVRDLNIFEKTLQSILENAQELRNS